jgi:excisionase family DNA binding protein
VVVAKPALTPIVLRPRDAARLLGLGHSHFYKLLKSGRIPHRKDGAATLILRADLEAFAASLPVVEREAAPPTGPLLPAAEPREPPDLAAVYAERLKIIVGNVGPDEGKLRAYEYAVAVCCSYHHVNLEVGKKMVSDAIKAARLKEL